MQDKYAYFKKITDDFGILQFAKLDQPDKESAYTLDDNARALMVAVTMEAGHHLAKILAKNLSFAQQADGSWSNLYSREFSSAKFDSDDSIGRALLACSLAMKASYPDVAEICANLLNNNWPKVNGFSSPRAMSYAILAMSAAPDVLLKDNMKFTQLLELSNHLLDLYSRSKKANWYWFEDKITYCNGILPQALWASYEITKDKRFFNSAKESMDFLTGILFRSGYLNIIGNDGWYCSSNLDSIPQYDQQPVEAASIAFACNEAYRVTADQQYKQQIELAFKWFHGNNINSQNMIDEKSGGCYDGITANGVNLNQGAESSLAYLLTDLLYQGRFSPQMLNLHN